MTYLLIWTAPYNDSAMILTGDQFFTEEKGYSQDDINNIRALKVGESYAEASPVPGHYIYCIPDIDLQHCLSDTK